MGGVRRFRMIAALLASAALVAAPGARAECRIESEDTAAVAEVTGRFEFRLDDGRLVRLAGLAPAAEFVGSALAARLRGEAQAAWGGRPVFVRALGGADRWGRIPAALAPVEGGAEVAAALLAAGAGRVGDAREGAAECAAARLEAERTARETGAGLWSDAYYAPQQAEDRAGLLARAGSFALVEGTVRRVGTGRLRLYLDFAGRDGFSVTATMRTIRAFDAAGTDVRALTGRRLRARGLIEVYAGPRGEAPRMELTGPGALELLDGAGR